MRDTLPRRVHKNEVGIINLDTVLGDGTHWTAYVKRGPQALYFNSIGNLEPPPEVVTYLKSDGSVDIRYNFERYQALNTYNCGHLCLEFLYKYA